MNRLNRMQRPMKLHQKTARKKAIKLDLKGKKIMITAGPTYEKIDPVRFIGNYSSGKMGFALAEECCRRGAEVTLVAGPVSLSCSRSYSSHRCRKLRGNVSGQPLKPSPQPMQPFSVLLLLIQTKRGLLTGKSSARKMIWNSASSLLTILPQLLAR